MPIDLCRKQRRVQRMLFGCYNNAYMYTSWTDNDDDLQLRKAETELVCGTHKDHR